MTIYDQSSPQWLDTMLETQRWRKVIYTLTQKQQSLLLSYAIRKITYEGYQNEISQNTPASASTFLHIFNEVLEASIHATLTSDDYQTAFANLKKLCSYREQTYLYAQVILTLLCHETDGQCAARLVEDLESKQEK